MAKKDDSEIGKGAPALSASLGAELSKDGGKIGLKVDAHSIEVAKEIVQLFKLSIGVVTGAAFGAHFGGGPGAIAGACIGTGIVSFDTLLQDRRSKVLIEGAVTAGLGGNTINQAVLELGPGSLLVSLHCFTDERFLEVLEDHKSGKLKERLENEFEQFGFKVKGLTVEIANKEEVNKTRMDIISKRSRSSTEVMTDREAKTTKTRQGFQIHFSKEHGNWLNVGQLIRSIQKPISIYGNEIVQALHDNLRKDLLHVGKCSTPEDCNKKTNPNDLCGSCKSWFDKLAASHEKGKNPSWHKNCNSARWPEDHWEVAKFFMPALGSNLSTVKHAESTDISSLLNVLEWLNNSAFLGKTRVNVDLVRKLRSEVRNTWAHAPQQELSDDEMADGFKIATDFLEDLEKVWPHTENGKCLQHLEDLKTDGVTEVTESELQSLLLQRRLLDDIKEEITEMKVQRSADKSTIEEHGQKLKNLERALNECSRRMSDFESFKDNMNKQFNNFAEDLKSFRAIPEDIHKIQNSIGQIHDELKKMNERQTEERKPTSCLPDRLSNFTAREAEIQNAISSLLDKKTAVVCLHGGPGFGKTSIANEVSHKLSEDHNVTVVFSQLTSATSVDEMIRQICRDVGVNHEDGDPKSSLILWLRKIEGKVIFVMDNIDNLIHDKDIDPSHFYEFICLLRKNSNQKCQIVTTSRISYEIPELDTDEVKVEEMDDEACVKLLRNYCPEQDVEFLRELAELCGKIPLAMCIAGPRVKEFEDPRELLHLLQKQPMKTLKSRKTNQYVDRAINMSYQKCSDEEKEILVRLAVFEGSFKMDAVKAVIEKESLDAANILHRFLSQSLIKQPAEFRYSFHLSIKQFLAEQVIGENETARGAKAQAMHAELLMVKYYVQLGHNLTMKSYSKDGYKESRDALKKEAHHIQNVLKICCDQKDPTTSEIPECLAQSKVYTTSARHFSLFVRTIIPGSIVNEFLQRGADMAKEKQQHAIKINFDCLLADQERIKSINKSDELFNAMMEVLGKEFEAHKEDIKEEKSLLAHYHYQYGRYLLRKAESEKEDTRLELQIRAREQLEKSLQLRKTLTGTSVGIADMVYSLSQLGKICKIISTTEHHLQRTNKSKNSLEKAEEYCNEAIKLSQKSLGEHELTSSCHKDLGDLFLRTFKHQQAEKEYNVAKEMRENLGLDANERHVFLLNNLGQCLTMCKWATTEAIEILESARDLAEKLDDSDEPNVSKTKVYVSLAVAYDLAENNSKAVLYAEKALKFQKPIHPKDHAKLHKIVEKNLARK